MALLEILMKPLLDAQRAAGREEAKAEFESWKARQLAAGVQFSEEEDEPENAEPPASDQ